MQNDEVRTPRYLRHVSPFPWALCGTSDPKARDTIRGPPDIPWACVSTLGEVQLPWIRAATLERTHGCSWSKMTRADGY